MPPEIVTKSNIGRGKDAMEWLEQQGYVAQTPYCHATDLDPSPFIFYLSRRLGLVPVLNVSAALSRGSYFHLCLETFGMTDEEADDYLARTYTERLKELLMYFKLFRITDEARAGILEREEKDFLTARGWWEASKTIKINDEIGTFHDFLSMPQWKHVGKELKLMWTHPDYPKTPFVCVIDRLLYHQTQNQLWIMDAKTTSDSPRDRLLTCPVEGQTQHYMLIVSKLLEDGTLQKALDLPDDCTLGGMFHWAFQKPSIVFGTKDRAHYFTNESKRSKLKGVAYPLSSGGFDCHIYDLEDNEIDVCKQETLKDMTEYLEGKVGTKIKRAPYGEPSLERFVARCIDWLRGEGEYQHEKATRTSDPPVNISRVSSKLLLDEDEMADYYKKVDDFYELATCEPLPKNFKRSRQQMMKFGRGLNKYAPFFVSTPDKWPEVIAREQFAVKYRDEIPTTGPDTEYISAEKTNEDQPEGP